MKHVIIWKKPYKNMIPPVDLIAHLLSSIPPVSVMPRFIHETEADFYTRLLNTPRDTLTINDQASYDVAEAKQRMAIAQATFQQRVAEEAAQAKQANTKTFQSPEEVKSLGEAEVRGAREGEETKMVGKKKVGEVKKIEEVKKVKEARQVKERNKTQQAKEGTEQEKAEKGTGADAEAGVEAEGTADTANSRTLVSEIALVVVFF
jgi:hypothetical protein